MRTYIQINPADNVVVAVKIYDRRIFGYQRQNNRCPAGYPCRAQSSLTGF